MPHFFIQSDCVNDDIITISDKETFHHLVRVLRVKKGEKLLLIDENAIQYETVIEHVDSYALTTKVVERSKSNHILDLQLFLAQSVLKTDAQNMLIQKATELGVKGVIPFISDNSVIKESVVQGKIDKWQKIANEAVKQCERADTPIIFKHETLESILKNPDYTVKIACVERSQDITLKKYLKSINSKDAKIIVIVGPEGGFTDKEIALFDQYNIAKVSLGNLILRAETAVINVLSNVIYELEND